VLVASGTVLAPSALTPVQPSLALNESPAFSAENATAHLSVLSRIIGSRPAGSAAQEQAVGYVADTWRSLGYHPVISPFQFNGFEEREVSLTVTDSGDRISGSILRGAPAGDIQAQLVDAGLGRAQDLDPTSLQGHIALIRRGEIRFSDKITNVSEAGAVGAVIDNSEPGGFIGTLTGPASIPAIGISQEDGRNIRRELAFGPLQVRLLVDGGSSEMTASNVSTSKAGTGDGIVVIGGHIDSVPAGPGANDNGSGTAVVTELGRAILGKTYPFEIRLAAFGAEELGLFGSKHYVATMSEDERQRVIGMINLDMVGVGTQLRIGGSPTLAAQGISAASSIGESASRMTGGLSAASDHASFIDAGMPGIFIYRSEDPNYHTANDLFEYVDPRHLDTAGRLVLALLDVLASDASA
jgi:Iap family predicted aminopeptidase